MRNFVRDFGNQVTLGVFVSTFVYSVLTLVAITKDSHGTFVPHLSITISEALLLVDLAVLIYFIHHIAKSIQLPEVIAGIARDLLRGIDAEFPTVVHEERPTPEGIGKSLSELQSLIEERGAPVAANVSGYLQFVSYAAAGRYCVSNRLSHPPRAPPGSLCCRRPTSGNCVAPRCRWPGRECSRQGTRDRPTSDSDAGPRLRHRPVGRDRDSRSVTCGQRHLYGAHLHRLAFRRTQPCLDPNACRRRLSRPARGASG